MASRLWNFFLVTSNSSTGKLFATELNNFYIGKKIPDELALQYKLSFH
jgi:hypothetical protein